MNTMRILLVAAMAAFVVSESIGRTALGRGRTSRTSAKKALRSVDRGLQFRQYSPEKLTETFGPSILLKSEETPSGIPSGESEKRFVTQPD